MSIKRGSASRIVFSEKHYLEKNPDVKNSVMTGKIASGETHFIEYGRKEGRVHRFAPDIPPQEQALEYYLFRRSVYQCIEDNCMPQLSRWISATELKEDVLKLWKV